MTPSGPPQGAGAGGPAGGGTLLLDAAALAGAGLVPRTGLDALLLRYLQVETLVVQDAAPWSPPPAGAALAYTGDASLLGMAYAPAEVAVTVDGGVADLSLAVELPFGWTFGASFPGLTGPPFDDLVFEASALLFATAPGGAAFQLPWWSEPLQAPQGLSFAGALVPAGPLGFFASLYGVSAADPILFAGPVDPLEYGSPVVCPLLSVSGQLSATGATLASAFQLGPASLSLGTVLGPHGLPFARLFVTTTLSAGSPTLEATAVLQPGGMTRFSVAPPPAAPPISFDDLAALLGGRELEGLIPPPLADVFAQVGLVGLSLTLLTSPLTVESISAAIGTTAPWPLAAGFDPGAGFEVENVVLRYTVLLPFASPSTEILFMEGDLALPLATGDPQSPTAEVVLEIEATLSSDGSVAVAGETQTAVAVEDLYATVTGGTGALPAGVPRLVFTRLGVAMQSSTSPVYTLWGDMDTAAPWEILGVPVAPALAFLFQSEPVSATLTGVLAFAGQTFTATMLLGGGAAVLSAQWADRGAPFSLADVATELGVPLPPLPGALDLTILGASLAYASASDELVMSLTTGYGAAVFVGLGRSPPQTCAILAIDQTFDLASLPLVGPVLGALETVEVNELAVVIASAGIDAAAVNAAIQQYAKGAPTIPQGEPLGEVTLFARVDLGGDPFVLALPLGGAGSPAVGESPAAGAGGGAADFALPAQVAPAPRGDRFLAAAPGGGAAGGAAGSVASTTPDGTVWFAVQQSFGPVTIQKIGVSYQAAAQQLWFEIDATLAFGPITLSLLELGVGASLADFTPVFSLQGIGVAYSNPPLAIAGSLMNLAPPGSPGSTEVAFGGEVVVSTAALSLTAIGAYQEVNSVPSLFVFLDVQKEFGGPPAFFVTGLAAGFGYNTALALPTVAQVPAFLFVREMGAWAGAGSPGQVTGVLATLLAPPPQPPWVSMQQGAIWGAAGITFTSFQLVSSVALLVVQSTQELVITLLGTSTAQYPQVPPGRPSYGENPQGEPYAFLQLELEASLQPSQGVLLVQAVLSRASFVLTPACVLTGGFAYALWFGPNAHAGDFVLTIGGYNPAFVAPAWYPAVPSVGFDWVVDSHVTLSGGAYLALTPSVFMLGGQLQATYTAGAFRAWFDAWADVLIRWSPFWFDAQIGISVGASYTLDLLFTHTVLSVELGCTLELWGPPTGGSVTVHWWVISLTFSFGALNAGGPPATWADVVNLLPASQSAPGQVALTVQAAAGLLSTVQDGSAGPAAWVVRPSTFAFTTSTPVPATSVSLNGAAVPTTLAPGATFQVHPLELSGVTAAHQVTVAPFPAQGPNPLPASAFTVTVAYGSVPAALWGAPPEVDGQPQLPAGDAQLVPGQVVGTTVAVVPPPPGHTVGPVAAAWLAAAPLFPEGALPLGPGSPGVPPPAHSEGAIGVIAETVASDSARAPILAGLALLGYAPPDAGGALDALAADTACWLTAPPLLA